MLKHILEVPVPFARGWSLFEATASKYSVVFLFQVRRSFYYHYNKRFLAAVVINKTVPSVGVDVDVNVKGIMLVR